MNNEISLKKKNMKLIYNNRPDIMCNGVVVVVTIFWAPCFISSLFTCKLKPQYIHNGETRKTLNTPNWTQGIKMAQVLDSPVYICDIDIKDT